MSDTLSHDELSSQATSTTPLLFSHDNDSHDGYCGTPRASSPRCEDQSPGFFGDGDNNENGKLQDGTGPVRYLIPVWSKWGLAVAYMSILLMAFTTSLEGQVTYPLIAFATSSFKNHSLLSTVYVVQSVVNAVIKTPMAKIANIFGRLEAFSISVTLCISGYVLMASSQNIETYASAQIFYSAGSTGLQILQQVFIADTSTFLNRALFSSLPESPFMVTVWIGPPIASTILDKFSWRWGYGIWAVILPVAFLPLVIILILNDRKTQKRDRSLVKKTPFHNKGTSSSLSTTTSLLQDLDIIGTLLLSSGLSLILLPLTLVSHSSSGWSDIRIQTMITLGIILLVFFPIFESQPNLAPHPLLPPFLLKSQTFVLGCCIGFFYFMIFYIAVQPYFYSYLLVALNLPIAWAGRVTQTFSFASTIAAILVSLGIRQLKVSSGNLRRFVGMGAGLYTLAIGILVYTRRRDATLGGLFLAQSVLGAGAGLMHVVTQLMVQASAANHLGPGGNEYVGVATAAFLTVVEVGGAVGAALSGAVWGRILPGKLEMYLPEEIKVQAGEIFSSVKVACGFAWGSVEREAIGRAYQETIVVLLLVALGLCIPLLVVVGLLSGSGRKAYTALGNGVCEADEVEGDGNVKGDEVGERMREGREMEEARER